MQSPVRQIDGLQVLRAAAVAIVAWGHAGLFYLDRSGRHLPDMGVFGIDIFFVLSGFILALIVLRSRAEPGVDAAWSFFLRRLVRIYPIYWIFAAISIPVLVHRHAFVAGHLASLLLLPFPHYPATPLVVEFTWTLIYEMFFYLLLSAIQIVTVRRAVPVLISVLPALTLLRFVTSIQRPVLIVVGNPMLLEFVYGAAIALAYRAWGRRRSLGMVLTVAGTAAAFCFLGLHLPSPTQQMILVDQQVLFRVTTWGLAAAAIVAGVVFWEPDANSGADRLAVAIGNASYSAYLGSALTIYGLSRLLHAVVAPQLAFVWTVRAVCQVASVVTVLAVGWVSYRWVEWPMLRSLQRRIR